MNIEQLEYIVEVAKCQSVSKAAESLHITQSGVSLSITALEKDLGIKIFTRSRLGAIPTEEGKVIINKSIKALEAIQDIKKEAYFYSNSMSGSLRFEAIPGLMSPMVKTFSFLKKKYPNLNIEISEKGSSEIVENFKANKIDAGFVALNQEMLQDKVGSDFEPFVTGKMVACVGKTSPLAQRSRIHPEEIRNESLVLYKDDSVEWFVEDFSAKFGSVQVLYKTNNIHAIESALREGGAMTIGHDYSFLNHPSVISGDLVTLDLAPYPQQIVYFGWLKKPNEQMHMISKQIIQLFKQALTGTDLL
ncbi:LysR family transcriptional regulator [Pontibacillus litoralis]|uniref:LysR family transcriptional regulator n=1 Tax=Pontibacillus litoralis JSM 072002 TaxID=1385512 RepID=A0A0A5G8B5_9BACI|nr:LysR family transcriptional regulator [Pontibacillus litoralis]KGX87360.1 LysR family transcriptional regulator [Pontibacillus litoralis JSM 072002]